MNPGNAAPSLTPAVQRWAVVFPELLFALISELVKLKLKQNENKMDVQFHLSFNVFLFNFTINHFLK